MSNWLQNLKGQITEFATEVLHEARNEVEDAETELQVEHKKHTESERNLLAEITKSTALERKLREMEEQLYSSNIENDSIKDRFEHMIFEREFQIKNLKAEVQRLRSNSEDDFFGSHGDFIDIQLDNSEGTISVVGPSSSALFQSSSPFPIQSNDASVQTIDVQKMEIINDRKQYIDEKMVAQLLGKIDDLSEQIRLKDKEIQKLLPLISDGHEQQLSSEITDISTRHDDSSNNKNPPSRSSGSSPSSSVATTNNDTSTGNNNDWEALSSNSSSGAGGGIKAAEEWLTADNATSGGSVVFVGSNAVDSEVGGGDAVNVNTYKDRLDRVEHELLDSQSKVSKLTNELSNGRSLINEQSQKLLFMEVEFNKKCLDYDNLEKELAEAIASSCEIRAQLNQALQENRDYLDSIDKGTDQIMASYSSNDALAHRQTQQKYEQQKNDASTMTDSDDSSVSLIVEDAGIDMIPGSETLNASSEREAIDFSSQCSIEDEERVEEITSLTQKLDESQAKLKFNEEQLINTSNELLEASSSISFLKDSLNKEKTSISHLNDKYEEFKAEYTHKESVWTENSRKLEQTVREKEAISLNLQESLNQFSQAYSQLEQRYHAEQASFQQQIDNVRLDLNKQQMIFLPPSESISVLDRQDAIVQTENSDEELVNTASVVDQEEITSLLKFKYKETHQKELDFLNAKISDLEEGKSEFLSQNVNLRSELDRLNQAFNASQTEVVECQRNNEQFANALQESQIKLQQLSEQATNKDREITLCQETESKLNSELIRLRNHLLTIEDVSAREALAAEERETELRKTVRALQDSASTNSESLSQNLGQLQDQVETLRAELITLEETNARLRSALVDRERTQNETSQSLANLQTVLKELDSDQKKEKSRFETELRSLRNECSVKTALAEEANLQVTQLRTSEDSLHLAISSLQDQLKQKSVVIEELENQLEEIRQWQHQQSAPDYASPHPGQQQKQLQQYHGNEGTAHGEAPLEQSLLHGIESEPASSAASSDNKSQKQLQHRHQQEYRIDDATLRQLFQSYFTADRSKQPEIAIVMTRILGYSSEEQETIRRAIECGGGTGSSKNSSSSWLWGLGAAGKSNSSSEPSISSSSNAGTAISLTEQFVQFLERESLDRTGPSVGGDQSHPSFASHQQQQHQFTHQSMVPDSSIRHDQHRLPFNIAQIIRPMTSSTTSSLPFSSSSPFSSIASESVSGSGGGRMHVTQSPQPSDPLSHNYGNIRIDDGSAIYIPSDSSPLPAQDLESILED